MKRFLRKLGLIGAVFFMANAIATITSLVILFMRSRVQTLPPVVRSCSVCSNPVLGAAKYCPACGSRV